MTTLYQLSVETFRRVLAASIGIMDKGAEHFEAQGQSPNAIVDYRFAADMAPFSSQVDWVRHHSQGAADGLLAGEFSPPVDIPEMDYQSLRQLLVDGLAKLDTVDEQAINARQGQPMYFRMQDFEMPFSSENFVMSFTYPNLFFHATTLYDMLRAKGVPLSKMDFLGEMKIGLPGA